MKNKFREYKVRVTLFFFFFFFLVFFFVCFLLLFFFVLFCLLLFIYLFSVILYADRDNINTNGDYNVSQSVKITFASAKSEY